MQRFSYSPAVRISILIQQAIGVFGLLVSTGITVLSFWGVARVEGSAPTNALQDPRYTLICIGLWAIGIGWTASLALINAFPTIWSGESGIVISAFLIFKTHIPWSEILDIRQAGVRFGHDLVVARRITVFHRIYGWLYSKMMYPSFLIRNDIEDHDRLITEVKLKRPS